MLYTVAQNIDMLSIVGSGNWVAAFAKKEVSQPNPAIKNVILPNISCPNDLSFTTNAQSIELVGLELLFRHQASPLQAF